MTRQLGDEIFISWKNQEAMESNDTFHHAHLGLALIARLVYTG